MVPGQNLGNTRGNSSRIWGKVSRYIPIGLIAIFILLAIWIRVIIPWHNVFTPYGIIPYETDPFLHMRIVDSLWINWPTLITIDPYLSGVIGYRPILAFSIVIISWLVSLGNITQQIIDTVGALIPAVCGVLLIVPTFIIGRELFGKWTGVIAAMLIAIYPGETTIRTSLGFTDHHAYEILFSSLVLMFLVLALKRNILFGIGCGVMLGLYLANWPGSMTLLLGLSGYILLQNIINHMKGESNVKICNVMILIYGIAIPISLIGRYFYQQQFYIIVVILACMLPLILLSLSEWTKELNPYAYPIIIFAGTAVVMELLYIIYPDALTIAFRETSKIFPASEGSAGYSISETQTINFQILWANINIGIVLGILGMAAIIYNATKKFEDTKVLFVVWCIGVIILTLLQRRFLYYLVPCVAILTGYVCWLGIEKLAFIKATRQINNGGVVLSAVAIIVLLFVPNIKASAEQAKQYPAMLSSSWAESLIWLRSSTPEPFGEACYYYKVYDKTDRPICIGTIAEKIAALKQIYPSAYRVLSWWDYGHWIVRMGRRPAVCSPTTGFPGEAARIFVSQNEEDAVAICREMGVRYVIVDWHMATDKFYAMLLWADTPNADQKKSLVYRLYYEDELSHFEKIFESTAKYGKESQIKIFEVTQ
jgi:oligosaccharyl transferase (archaeosortase A-associated)